MLLSMFFHIMVCSDWHQLCTTMLFVANINYGQVFLHGQNVEHCFKMERIQNAHSRAEDALSVFKWSPKPSLTTNEVVTLTGRFFSVSSRWSVLFRLRGSRLHSEQTRGTDYSPLSWRWNISMGLFWALTLSPKTALGLSRNIIVQQVFTGAAHH